MRRIATDRQTEAKRSLRAELVKAERAKERAKEAKRNGFTVQDDPADCSRFPSYLYGKVESGKPDHAEGYVPKYASRTEAAKAWETDIMPEPPPYRGFRGQVIVKSRRRPAGRRPLYRDGRPVLSDPSDPTSVVWVVSWGPAEDWIVWRWDTSADEPGTVGTWVRDVRPCAGVTRTGVERDHVGPAATGAPDMAPCRTAAKGSPATSRARRPGDWTRRL